MKIFDKHKKSNRAKAKKTKHKQLRNMNNVLIAACALMIAIVIGLGVLVFVEGPAIITKQITGLTLTQKGMNIEVSWDEMECNGYEVTVKSAGVNNVISDVNTNSYRITNITPNREYKVVVKANLDRGSSRAAKKKITAHKLEQKLNVAETELRGFKGDSFEITVEAEGDVSFTSDNEKIATVDKKGNVHMKKSGHAVISASLPETGLYANTVRTIDVSVVPSRLGTTKVRSEIASASRAKLTWKEVDYATEYHVVKKNLETGEFNTIKVVEGEETSTEVTRATGYYAVKGVARIGDKSAEGKNSEPVKITGAAENAKSYSSGKNIKTLDKSNLDTVAAITGSGKATVPQSMSFNGSEYIVSYVNKSGTVGALVAFDRNGKRVRSKSISGAGHANGSTYNPNTGKIYTVKTHKQIKSPRCTTYNEKDFTSAGAFNLPKNASGIAYDESNNKYYITKGNEIYVLDTKFNKEEFVWKSIRYNHAQDVGAYNGVALVCTWISGNKSYIDMYRVSDEKYLGSYYVPIGEIESCVVDDGYLIILMNVIGSGTDYIYKTKERVEIP